MISSSRLVGELHNKHMRVYEWIAPTGTDPHAAAVLLEAALPGLKLYHRGDNEQNGYVNTSPLPDGTLNVGVHLYDNECSDLLCPAGHGAVKIKRAPPLTPAQMTALVEAVGEVAQLEVWPPK